MNPFLGGLLGEAVPGLLGSLFGASQSAAAQKRARAYRAEIMRTMSPDYLRNLQNQFYNQWLAGPAFEAARRNAFNAAANMTNRLGGNLAARGLSNSGVGAISSALAGSALGGQLGNIRSNAFNAAGNMAESQQERALRALQSLGAEPNYNYGTQALGGTLGDLGNYFTNYFQSKQRPYGLPYGPVAR